MDGSESENTTNHHGSVSEDAFNDVESTTMYADNDFILLTDILPPGNVAVPVEDVPNSFDDMLLDGEVLRSPVLQDMNLVSDTLNVSTEQAITDLLSVNSQNDSNVNTDPELFGQIESSAITSAVPDVVLPKKRGRKKKVPVDNVLPSNTSSKQPQNETKGLDSRPKRGRKLKPRLAETETPAVTNMKPKTPRNIRNKNKCSNDFLEPAADENLIPKNNRKRGRKQKIYIDENNETNVETDMSNKQNDEFTDMDDICLSSLASQPIENSGSEDQTLVFEPIDPSILLDQTEDYPSNVITPILSDFDCNMGKVIATTSSIVVETVGDAEVKNITTWPNANNQVDSNSTSNIAEENNSLLVEDGSKRPTRRKALKKHYEIDSDEDPFANVELSDDDQPKKRRKGIKYYSDDEYIPENVGKKSSSEEDIESDFDIDENEKKQRKKSTKSPAKRKRSLKSITKEELASAEKQTDRVEIVDCSSTEPQTSESRFPTCNKAFENFIAERMKGTSLQIKKVPSNQSSQNAPLEIPVLDPKEAKKMVDKDTQTVISKTKTAMVQTSTPYALKITKSIDFKTEQSEKACEFLKTVLSSTSELGQLLINKSEDFLQKKINTNHVKDTDKMDYCIKKAFLLLKLAKENLSTMEENLEQQYEEFLRTNKLSEAIEVEKKIVSKVTKPDSDSDCEIVEGPVKPPEKPKFNPKTVFLNKELSIKIAKKPAVPAPKTKQIIKKEAAIIKEKNSVWINEGIILKKVKGPQSFLAQDGRNKKPPDCITKKMVQDFFDSYYANLAHKVCSDLTSPYWLSFKKPLQVSCCYFIVSASDSLGTDTASGNIPLVSEMPNPTTDEELSGECENNTIPSNTPSKEATPKKLFSICTQVIKNLLVKDKSTQITTMKANGLRDLKSRNDVMTLFTLCVNRIAYDCSSKHILGSCGGELKKKQAKHEKNRKSLNKQGKNGALQLKSLCFNEISKLLRVTEDSKCEATYSFLVELNERNTCDVNEQNSPNEVYKKVSQLKSLCFNRVSTLLRDPNESEINFEENDGDSTEICSSYTSGLFFFEKDITNIDTNELTVPQIPQPLQNIVLEKIQFLMSFASNSTYLKLKPRTIPAISKNSQEVKSLKALALAMLKRYFDFKSHENDFQNLSLNILTIDTVNTLSEEAYFNMNDPSREVEPYSEGDDYYGDEHYDDDEVCRSFENGQIPDSNWVSQVQLQESKYGILTDLLKSSEIEPSIQAHESPLAVQIKTEVQQEPECNPLTEIKKEPDEYHSSMVVIPESVVTKSEYLSNIHSDTGNNQVHIPVRSNSFDMNTFESFVSNNKLIHGISYQNDIDEIFSQSALRVRRQHAPDSDNESENSNEMSLLIPQAAEVHVETAKGSLMESSSDENSKGITSDNKSEKKKRKQKKKRALERKETPIKNAVKVKESPMPSNNIAILTRKMKERIRNEEKNNASSESDSENMSILTRREAEKKKNRKEIIGKAVSTTDISDENEIQCNSVDSTQQIDGHSKKAHKDKIPSFTGFSTVDQNNIDKYQKYVNFVYDKIIAKDGEKNIPENSVQESEVQDKTTTPATHEESKPENEGDRYSPVMMSNEPVELLECEPTIPLGINYKSKGVTKKKPPKKSSTNERIGDSEKPAEKPKEHEISERDSHNYVDRHGWQCYPTDQQDIKLHKSIPYIGLQKLPEEFVQTYFKYQNITMKSKEDLEIDRLSNLTSLRRIPNANDEGPAKPKSKRNRERAEGQNDLGKETGDDVAGSSNSDHDDEETESCDEFDNTDCPPLQSTDNCLAKNSLMDDHESDTQIEDGTKIKQETSNEVKKRSGTNERKIKIFDNPQSLVLTADKMMKKELEQLHASVTLDDEKDIKPSAPKISNQKSSEDSLRPRRKNKRDRVISGDDSSSEEEKQWVSTKSKLLKRMEKKIETNASDDAKRAKLVSEYIERKSDNPGTTRQRGRPRRSMKKFLAREKQLRVLQKELCGDSSAQIVGKSSNYSKGRKNIRKVLDKKSLQKKTVIANMEEFERKRRLSQKQAQLRELLNYDESVNVLVIDDEMCLEYDFELRQPVVSVHPFFTKVMKAHQYEGVKFMWDACFESLEKVESGHPGSGCILAHCMGLGKTLQVLALLQCVLSHPRVNMRRVLVCCPLSTVLNWVDEIHKWLGPVTDQIKVFELSKLKKTYERAYQLEDWYNGGGIFIIGYELFRSLTTLDPELDDVRPTIIKKIRHALLDPGPDIIVCDEGHLLKNDSSVLAVAMSRVVTKRRIILTGTPMQNNLREYYCMVNFIKPSLLGTYQEYSNRFENPIMNGQHRDSREEDIKLMKARTHILHKVLEGCLQRQEASVLYPYLPKKHEYTVFIALSPCQIELYRHYLSNYAGNSSKVAKHNLLKDFHVLQKIWSHPRVLHNFQKRLRNEGANKVIKDEIREDDLAREDLTATEDVKPADTEVWWLEHLDGGNMLDSLESSNKFVVVFKILKECVELGDKLLIFSTSLYTMDALEHFLQKINKWSLGVEYYRLDGSVPPEVRQKWCREFNAEKNTKTKLFLISTRAGSLGLNLTAANRVIILDTSWNPAHDIQSIFRVYRFGQKKDCFIYRLVAMGTMEQKIYERSVTKQAVACRVVDEQQIDRHYNMAELTELYRFDVLGEGVAGGVALGVRDVVLLRVARDTPSLHAAHEHDSLLRDTREQDLPAHERDEAWTQFELEHRHKQMQDNQPVAILPARRSLDNQPKGQSVPIRVTSGPSVLTAKHDGDPEYNPRGPPLVPKKGRGRPKDTTQSSTEEFKTPNDPTELFKRIQEALRNVSEGLDPKEVAKIVSNAVTNANIVYKPYEEPSRQTTDKEAPRMSRKEDKCMEKESDEKSDEYIVDDDYVPDNDGPSPPPVAATEESIVLSDEDITPPKKEVIPLHPSLLKNKNFIKIVAHSYLKRNPTMDVEAAMLAAEYSTSKAIKEVEETGKNLTSGPIYDIAYQVLGEETMLKLNNSDKLRSQNTEQVDKNPITAQSSVKTDITVTTLPEQPRLRVKSEMSLNASQEVTNMVTSVKNTVPSVKNTVPSVKNTVPSVKNTVPSVKTTVPSLNTSKMTYSLTESTNLATVTYVLDDDGPSTSVAPVQLGRNSRRGTSAVLPLPPPPAVPSPTLAQHNIVPVELIQNTENMNANNRFAAPEEESILPDDDDVRIMSAPNVSNAPIAPNASNSPIASFTPSAPHAPNAFFAPNALAAPASNRLIHILRKKKGPMTIYKSLTSTGQPLLRLGTDLPSGTPRLLNSNPVETPATMTPVRVRKTVPVTAFPSVASTPQSQLTKAAESNTICIDSDDDDPPAVAGPPPPLAVPINNLMLTMDPSKNYFIVPAHMMGNFDGQTNTLIPLATQPSSLSSMNPKAIASMTIAPQPIATKLVSQPTLVPASNKAAFKQSSEDKLLVINTDRLERIQLKPGPKSKTETKNPSVSKPGPKSKTETKNPSVSKPGPKSKTETKNSLVCKPGPKSKTETKNPPVSKPGPASRKTRDEQPGPKSPKVVAESVSQRRISIASSDSSDEQRSTTPDDPLAVLQNVVHIPAHRYETPTFSTSNEPVNDVRNSQSYTKSTRPTPPLTPTAPMQSSSTISERDTNKKTYGPASRTNKQSITAKPEVTFDRPLTVKPSTSGKSSSDGKKAREPPKQRTKYASFDKKIKSILEKIKEKKKPETRMVSSVDLTEDPTPNTKPSEPVTAKKTTKIVSTSNNIIINSTGSITKAQKTKTQSSTLLASSQPSTSATNAKRKAPPTTEPPKKKLNKPMRLEDFSLDDYEDIIELE